MASVLPTSTPTSTRVETSRSTITRKNAGPLTTAFDAPSRCFDRTLDSAVSATLDQGGFDYAKDLSIFVTDFRSAHSICPSASFIPCLPHYSRYSKFQGRGIFFSPGLECPTSWQTVASATASNTSSNYLYVNGIIVSTLLPDESAYVCCPIGFDYIVNIPPSPPVVYCTSAVSKFDAMHKQWSCSGNSMLEEMIGTDAGYAITLASTANGRTSKMPVSFMTVKLYAPTIQLNRRPHDVPASLTMTTMTTGTQNGDPQGGSAQDSGQGRGTVLHGGAIAGIAVGAVGLIALLGVAVALLWNRRRKRHEADAAAAGWNKPELDGVARPDPRHGRSELEASERHELDAGRADQVFELQESRMGAGGGLPGNVNVSNETQTKRWSGLRFGRG
ncbi:hypothetical protein HRG_000071 [Hirsutella rhossiliensis]|uniref:Uncharacterized protein n=1 Tax=Hirsutella rhossiliensis TaxID=111463 RepID=A0A9P8SMK8_9HYPO|nr:uncharacterized protein HRG_00071 [Hirsutella rhossiliensis]KAH0967429.1 hypothetical protein HRG_00071 [Hirsutella rhossiliensis]